MKAAPAQDERLTPEEQAGAWCARLATGNLPSTQQAEFDTWLTSDPVHVGRSRNYLRSDGVQEALFFHAGLQKIELQDQRVCL